MDNTHGFELDLKHTDLSRPFINGIPPCDSTAEVTQSRKLI